MSYSSAYYIYLPRIGQITFYILPPCFMLSHERSEQVEIHGVKHRYPQRD